MLTAACWLLGDFRPWRASCCGVGARAGAAAGARPDRRRRDPGRFRERDRQRPLRGDVGWGATNGGTDGDRGPQEQEPLQASAREAQDVTADSHRAVTSANAAPCAQRRRCRAAHAGRELACWVLCARVCGYRMRAGFCARHRGSLIVDVTVWLLR